MPHRHLLGGLDGGNPLGFMAALGTLQALAELSSSSDRPSLVWRNEGIWLPELCTTLNRDELAQVLAEDVLSWHDDPSLALKYPKKEGNDKLAHDLKPKPEEFRRYLQSLLDSERPRRLRALTYASAFGTEVALDNNGNVKPTALHFTAGQQELLGMITQLVSGAKGSPGVGPADFEEALWGPWRYQRPLPVLGWDATSSRDYALRASDPSTDKKVGVPAADWLAFRGLAMLPVAPSGGRIITPCCYGGWKDGHFQWPLWTVAIPADVVRCLVGRDGLESIAPAERRAIGIGIFYRCRIRRSDQGGYGSFTPAQVV